MPILLATCRQKTEVTREGKVSESLYSKGQHTQQTQHGGQRETAHLLGRGQSVARLTRPSLGLSDLPRQEPAFLVPLKPLLSGGCLQVSSVKRAWRRPIIHTVNTNIWRFAFPSSVRGISPRNPACCDVVRELVLCSGHLTCGERHVGDSSGAES